MCTCSVDITKHVPVSASIIVQDGNVCGCLRFDPSLAIVEVLIKACIVFVDYSFDRFSTAVPS